MIKITESIKIVPETQTQIVVCTQASKFLFGTPESPTIDVADLEDKTATELKKLQALLEKKARRKLLVLSLLQLHLRMLERNWLHHLPVCQFYLKLIWSSMGTQLQRKNPSNFRVYPGVTHSLDSNIRAWCLVYDWWRWPAPLLFIGSKLEPWT